MSEQAPFQEKGAALQRVSEPPQTAPRRPDNQIARWLERGDTLVQSLVGILFFLGALGAIGYAIYHFFSQLTTPVISADHGQSIPLNGSQTIAEAIVNLISDLLLVLIITEILNTVLHYLRERAVLLKPFLFVGMISATRDILAIGARLAVIGAQGDQFTHLMIELGVNVGIVLGLGITLRLLTKEAATDALS